MLTFVNNTKWLQDAVVVYSCTRCCRRPVTIHHWAGCDSMAFSLPITVTTYYHLLSTRKVVAHVHGTIEHSADPDKCENSACNNSTLQDRKWLMQDTHSIASSGSNAMLILEGKINSVRT